MLLVVSPNLAIDRILEVDGFRMHEVQRSASVISQPGGKGSNVARVFRQLGGEVILIGFVGRQNGHRIREPLRSMGIRVEAIDAYGGESRHCTILRDPSSNAHPTVVNEESSQVEPQAIETIERTIEENLRDATAVLVTGSLSRGLPHEFYARVIERASSRQVLTAIDAAGPVLKAGLEAKPTLVKSNLREISSAVGEVGTHPLQIAGSLRRFGLASQAIVTLGEAGSILAAGDECWYAKPPRIFHVNPIGAGDAFAAGYLKVLMEGGAPDAALRFATAVAASDAATPEPGWIHPSRLTRLLSDTPIQRLSAS